MKFGPLPLSQAEGSILAHTTRVPGRVIKKGRLLDADDLAEMQEAGLKSLIVARLEEDDLGEDEAALAIAQALAGSNIRVSPPFTGRCNLFAEAHGVLDLDRRRLDGLNAIHEAITLATAPLYEVVSPGQMISTVKIIPFAVGREWVEAASKDAQKGGALVNVAAFGGRRVGLILARLPGMKESILDKTLATVAGRIEQFGSQLVSEIRCSHEQGEMAGAITQLSEASCDLILLFGASATVDRQDVAPAAVVQAGGRIDHFGMPVDPGNLLFLGEVEAKAGAVSVVGMPGCARSPKLNGFDWVLWRLLAGLPVRRENITGMGGGGLLKEITERGLPRLGQEVAEKESAAPNKIAGLLLAAGSSRRMGAANKLISEVEGQPMIRRVAGRILEAGISPLIVVTGHDGEKIEDALSGLPVQYHHNSDHDQGLSASLRTGLDGLPQGLDGVVVCLGDMPEVTSRQIENLVQAFDPLEGRSICVPVFGRKRGNPVLWSNRFFAEMASLSGDLGARQLLEEHGEEVCEVTVEDDGVLFDVDTPERLAELTQRHEKTEL